MSDEERDNDDCDEEVEVFPKTVEGGSDAQKIYGLQKQLASMKAQLDQLVNGIESSMYTRYVRKGKTSARSTYMSRGAMVTNILEAHPQFDGIRRVSPASYERVKREMMKCETPEHLEAALLKLDNYRTYVATRTTTADDVSELIPYEMLVDQVRELTKYMVEVQGRRELLVQMNTLPLDFNGVHDFRRGMGWEVLELVRTKGGTPAEHWAQLERDYKALKGSGGGGGGKRSERSSGSGDKEPRATKTARSKGARPTTTRDDRPIAPFVAGPVNRDGAPAVPLPPEPLNGVGPTWEENLVMLEATKHLAGAESTQRFNELTFECITKREGHAAAAGYMRRLFPDFQVPQDPITTAAAPLPPPPMETAYFPNLEVRAEDIGKNHPMAVEVDDTMLPGEMQFDAAEALTELGLTEAGLAFNNAFLADQFESDFPKGIIFNLQPVQQTVVPVVVVSAEMEVESVAVTTVRAEMELETVLVETMAKALGKIRVTLTKPSVFPTTTLPPRQLDGTVVLGGGGGGVRREMDGRKLFSHSQRQPVAMRDDTDLDELIPVRSNYGPPIVIDDIEDDIEEEEEEVSSSALSSIEDRRAALKKIIDRSSPIKSSTKKAKLVIEDQPSSSSASASSMSSVDTAPKKKPATSLPPKKNKAAKKPAPTSAKKPAPEKKRAVDERPAHDDEEPAPMVAAVVPVAGAARAPRRRKSEMEMLEPWAFDANKADTDTFVFVVPSEVKAKQEFEAKKREREMQQRNRVWGRHI